MTQLAPLTVIVGTICNPGPELRFTESGLALTKFSVRVPGKNAKDGQPKVEASFVQCAAWRELAESVAESLQPGDRVIVQGVLKTRTYTKSDGTEGSSTELNAWNVGAELSYATVQITRNERKDSAGTVPVGAPQAAAADFGDF
jgi:single-strand DNA-binding protein